MQSSSSSDTSDDQTVNNGDIERNTLADNSKHSYLAVFRRIPVPLHRERVGTQVLRTIAFLAIVLCIFQYFWIQHINNGLSRVSNGPFDVVFWKLNRQSPEIWDDERQAFIHDAIPVPVHSHNDYSRGIPLFEALGSGCISVEADIHLRGSDLLVGHTSKGLKSDSNLRSMYLAPLQRMIQLRNKGTYEEEWRGIFRSSPHQTVVLLVDVKTSGPETFAELHAQLQPLRDLDFLTYWNGTERIIRPLTVVASGNAPFESILALDSAHRDIFWDAKLENLFTLNDDLDVDPPIYGFNQSNSYFASTRWTNARLFVPPLNYTYPEGTKINAYMKDMALPHIEQAKARGLISRFWDTPEGPPNLREIAWRVLIKLKTGILNMDDMGTVRARASGWGSL
ncbi:hypothetical protein BU24DRAFT_419119 [Aaosphaeria arxii CBS 175.79]|uniref:Altered inheritance of mitochondria protein 6 n=1 Tax=Aaosphaeria arxii CBS 175.79 TaxID=1450172 RepID=A0A6A5Y4R5_9PLEO|nr:uncharacterized protein BU24DRAFT_419119 [Aaosphaeria arxii CBS 175.79]KAF2019504.1 hypothetical protein BU24DRAFT_419119 [Aaosphaeria arxii CBS 175.79]